MSKLLLVTLATLAASALAAPIARAAPDVVVMNDNVTAQLVVTDELDASPPGYRVRWIAWDSGFRGTGLQLGDRIIAVDGVRLALPADRRARQQVVDRSIGHMFEHQGWAALGKKDGAAVGLTVIRRKAGQGFQTVEVKGTLRAERRYKGSDGRSTLGPGGPAGWQREVDGEAWDTWYGKRVEQAQQVLDGGWQRPSLSNRYELDQVRAQKPRLDYLIAHYPGPFTDAFAQDYRALEAALAGTRYQLTEADLAYRGAVERRIAEVAAAGVSARARFLTAHAAEQLEPFPAIDPMTGNRKALAGKLAVLPTLGSRDFVMEGGRCFIVAGDRKRGWYFLDCNAPSTRRMFAAIERYQRLVDPAIGSKYELVVKLTGEPQLLTHDDQAITGHAAVVAGATVGDRFFVDTTVEQAGASPFAGEAALAAAAVPPLPATATPAQVIEAMVRALEDGHEDTWTSLFATWRASRSPGYVSYLPAVPLPKWLPRTWVDARALVLGRVYDARVVWVSDVETVVTPRDYQGAPTVEQVTVELEHVGKFDGEYRAFTAVAVHRLWQLQRVDGGPWRITTFQTL